MKERRAGRRALLSPSIFHEPALDMANVSLSGFKPVAWAGHDANVTLRGIPHGGNLTYVLDGQSLSPSSETRDNGSVTVTFPAGDAKDAVSFKTLQVQLGGQDTFAVNVTVWPEPAPLALPEQPVWLEMFESGSDGWNASNWAFDTLWNIVGQHGTGGKQRFSRASGVIAAAVGAGPHSLVSPAIDLGNKDIEYELRFASHYNTSDPKGQDAHVSVSYDGKESERLFALNETAEGAQHRVRFKAAAGAKPVFTFAFEGKGDNAYWLIDDVAVVRPLGDADGEPTEVIDIISDIQGTPQNDQMRDSLLPGLRKYGNASTLVINGDLVSFDSPGNWDNFTKALRDAGTWEHYGERNVLSTLGNHEMYYMTPDSRGHIDNFLNASRMTELHGEQGRGLWGEHVTEAGTPLVWMSSEHYSYVEVGGLPPFVNMSDTQYAFLAGRLQHWREQGKPVLLFSHFALPYSVSGTWTTFDSTSFGHEETRLRYLLAANPHALLITSHTHWDIAALDQNVDHRPLVGYNSTITTFNTGATLNYVGIGGADFDGDSLGDGAPTGLRAEIYGDRIRVNAYRFWNLTTDGTLIQTRDVPSPYSNASAAKDRSGTKEAKDGKDGSSASAAAPWGFAATLAAVLVTACSVL